MKLIKRTAVIAAVGGAIVASVAGPAGATTVGLLTASQLPSGYIKASGPLTISGATIIKDVKKVGGGVGGFTTSCKGAPSPTSLAKSTAHIVTFAKSSGGVPSLLAETVIETQSSAVAAKYLAAAKASAANCTAKETLTVSGTKVNLAIKTHNVSINKEGADDAVGTILGVSGTFSEKGETAKLAGSLGVETYRKGADLVEIVVENIGIKSSGSTVSLSFSSGSASVRSSVGKAAIKDL